jgi:hypothetical protein
MSLSKSQIGELGRHGVTTVAALAAVSLPLQWKPERGTVQSLERVREQARLQVEIALDSISLWVALQMKSANCCQECCQAISSEHGAQGKFEVSN